MRRFLLALIVLDAIASTRIARANPADLFELGPRAAALGGAACAVADDSSAVYYNPAGLARASGLRIDLAYQYGQPLVTMNGKDSHEDAMHGFSGGLAAPGTIAGVRFAFGVAIFLPDDRLNRTRSLAFEQPRWVEYDNRTQRVYLAAGLGVRVWKGLSVGASLAFMARTQGTVALTGNISATEPDTQSLLGSAVSVDLLSVRYPQAGVAWEVLPWLTLGATYRHSFLLKLDQGFTIRGTVSDAGKVPVVANGMFDARTVSTDLFQPWQHTAGAALRITRRLLLAYDLTFARWSEFETPATNVTVSLSLGAALDQFVHIPPARAFPPPGFHDILIPRLGVEWRAFDRDRIALDLRAGYRYEPSPVPEQTGASNYADASKHRFSLGAGLLLSRIARVLPRQISIDAHFAVTALPPQVNRKTDPTDPVGDFVASGAVVEAGLGTRWGF